MSTNLGRLGRGVASSILAVLMASCVATPVVSPMDATKSPAALTRFDVSGGLGIWTDTENFSSRLRWQQRADDFSFDLIAPLGMASLRLDQKDQLTTVTRGNSVVARSNDPGVALQQALGLSVPVPVSQIAQWLKGQPGDANSTTLDSAGLMQSLRYVDQSGMTWDAVIRKRRVFQNVSVPALITATGGPYNVRIVLKNWAALASNAEPELAPELEQKPASGPDPSPAELSKPSQRLVIPTQ